MLYRWSLIYKYKNRLCLIELVIYPENCYAGLVLTSKSNSDNASMDHRFYLFFYLGISVISTLNSLRHGQEMQIKFWKSRQLYGLLMRESFNASKMNLIAAHYILMNVGVFLNKLTLSEWYLYICVCKDGPLPWKLIERNNQSMHCSMQSRRLNHSMKT